MYSHALWRFRFSAELNKKHVLWIHISQTFSQSRRVKTTLNITSVRETSDSHVCFFIYHVFFIIYNWETPPETHLGENHSTIVLRGLRECVTHECRKIWQPMCTFFQFCESSLHTLLGSVYTGLFYLCILFITQHIEKCFRNLI